MFSHDTLYAAILIPLTRFSLFNETDASAFPSVPESFSGPSVGPPNAGSPLYGFVRGDMPGSMSYYGGYASIGTDKISLLDCAGNHKSNGDDDLFALLDLNASLNYGRNGPQPWWNETQLRANQAKSVTHVKDRFWECLETNKKGVGVRLQECLCMELRDLDPSNPFTYPMQLSPRAYDTDSPSEQYEQYWKFMNRLLCVSNDGLDSMSPFYDFMSYFPFPGQEHRRPSACKDLDKYDEYDAFKARFYRDGEDAMPALYEAWVKRYITEVKYYWSSPSRLEAHERLCKYFEGRGTTGCKLLKT
ncbi:hypothetical protein BJ508DRAFT_315098 [Ascobolus immersus RN42]|uniref:Uncharacterized protein n=1 Tax=Ascobolus immersus RN42 TaxID=1160509 RepID=A0A3N4HGR5_ASCIM|nr:hypothetical protein BJ508DRAFT_315098 [Ascobolus immersus RN42]